MKVPFLLLIDIKKIAISLNDRETHQYQKLLVIRIKSQSTILIEGAGVNEKI